MTQESFVRAAERYADTVFRVAYSQTRSREDADDVTQDVLLKLLETEKDFEGDAHLKHWLSGDLRARGPGAGGGTDGRAHHRRGLRRAQHLHRLGRRIKSRHKTAFVGKVYGLCRRFLLLRGGRMWKNIDKRPISVKIPT